MKKENLEEELKETKEQLQETKEKVENLEKDNKKMSPVMSVLLGVLFVVIGFVFGYYLSSYLFNDENVDEGNKTEQKEETKEEDKLDDKEDEDKEEDKSDDKEEENDEKVELEKLDVNSPVVKELFEIFREDKDDFVKPGKGAYFDLNTSLTTKKYIAYKQLNSSVFSEKKCSEFKSKYTKDGAECGIYSAMNGKAIVFNASVLEIKYRELFGQNAEYVNGEFSTNPISEAYYDEKNGLYAEFYHLDGDERAPYSYNQTLESINQSGTVLTLTTKLNATALDESFTSIVTNITYTFEYEKETGNYIFVNRLVK